MNSEEKEVALVIIKPDAILRGLVGKILSFFEQRGYWINALTTRIKNRKGLQALFDSIYQDRVVDAINEYAAKPLIGFLIYGEKLWRLDNIVGHYHSPENCAIGTIREQFGLDTFNNSVEIFLNTPNMFDTFYSTENEEDIRREA